MSWFEVIAKRMTITSMAYTDFIMQKYVREPRNVNQILDLMFDDSKIEEYRMTVYYDYKHSKDLEYRAESQMIDRLHGWPTSITKRQLPTRGELKNYLKRNYSSGDEDTLTGEMKYWSD